jgi:hypothetical protein
MGLPNRLSDRRGSGLQRHYYSFSIINICVFVRDIDDLNNPHSLASQSAGEIRCAGKIVSNGTDKNAHLALSWTGVERT